MAPKSEESPLTRQELQFLDDFRLKPDPWGFERIFRVEDREHPGKLIPFAINAGQRLIDDTIQRILALNLQFQVDALLQGEPTYIEEKYLRAWIEKKTPVPQHLIGMRLLIGKSRRGGFSTYTIGKGLKRICTTPNYSCLLMAHADDSAQDIWGIGHRMYDHWPNEWIRCRPDTKYDSTDYFELDGLESRYAISTAGKHPEAESKRGWRFDYYHFSEYAHYKSYADVAQCISASMPYSWILKESTANGRSGPFYDEWLAALTIDEAEEAYRRKDFETLSKWGTPGNYKFFFSWLDDPGLVLPVYEGERHLIEDNLDDYEKALMKKDPRFTLGKVKWRRLKIRDDCQNHPKLPPEQLFQQEFPATPEEMFQATGSAVFDERRIEIQQKEAAPPRVLARVFATQPPIETVEAGANFRMYAPPRKDRAYIIGADVSKGVERDYSVAIVLDRCDGTRFEEAAIFRSNVIDERDFGHVMTMIGEMYGNAFIVPEVNQGLLAASTLVTENRYWNVYERQTFDSVNMDPGTNTFRFGFFTSNQTKSFIVQTTRNMWREGLIRVHSPAVLHEMLVFQVDPETNKYGKPKGENDDCVDALCLGVHGARHAPSLDFALERAKASIASSPAEMSRMERKIFEAIQQKKARSAAKNRRAPDFRPAIK